MFELIFIFISFIVKIVKYYIFTLLPTLILISVLCVLIGMCIRSGMKGGMSILIIIITIVIFTFVIYGKNTIKIVSKVKDKIVNTYFSNKAIFSSSKDMS
jgi:hypothetical protein